MQKYRSSSFIHVMLNHWVIRLSHLPSDCQPTHLIEVIVPPPPRQHQWQLNPPRCPHLQPPLLLRNLHFPHLHTWIEHFPLFVQNTSNKLCVDISLLHKRQFDWLHEAESRIYTCNRSNGPDMPKGCSSPSHRAHHLGLRTSLSFGSIFSIDQSQNSGMPTSNEGWGIGQYGRNEEYIRFDNTWHACRVPRSSAGYGLSIDSVRRGIHCSQTYCSHKV